MSENWTNEAVLEFLSIYEKHSVIWDAQNINHKNRNIVNDAWNDIQREFSMECTVDILKKKKESLMSTYRTLKKKVMASERTGTSTDDLYKPSWFAFSIMDGFLKNVEIIRPTINTERTDEINATETQNQDEYNVSTQLESMATDDDSSQPATPVAKSNQTKSKRKADSVPLGSIEKNMKKAYEALETISESAKQRKQEQQLDECALYGQLIASKLRKLSNLNRLTLMNKFDNLIFQAELNELSNASPTNYTPNNTASNLNVVTYEDQLEYPYYSDPSSVQSRASTSAVDDSSNSAADYYSQANRTLNLQEL